MIAKFFMKSGNVVEVPDVEDVSLEQGVGSQYTKWSVTWKKGKRSVALLSISLSEIEAVIVYKDQTTEE